MKNIISYSLFWLCTTSLVFGQSAENATKTGQPEAEYRRSSLYTLMVEETDRPMLKTIRDAFVSAPIPEKFNDHNLTERTVPFSVMGGNPADNLRMYLEKKDVPKQMISKWFNRKADGTFDMELISKRGFYNASDLDVKKALASKRGMATIADAGEELIKNTFVVVNDFKYVNKEDIADAASTGLMLAGGIMTAITGDKTYQNAGTALAVGAQIAGKGYVVKSTVYLYQLVWNDSVSAVFYNDLWTDASAPSKERKLAFDNSNLFSLKYIGSSSAYADVQSSIFTDKSEAELIAMATKRAAESALVKLEKSYETFRTKTPLYGVKPYRAKIGLKEGVRKQQRYFVYEKRLNSEGKTYYKKVGVLRVKRKKIWDNQYALDGAQIDPSVLTQFYKVKGRPLMPGMLIQQRPDRGFFKPFNIFFGQFTRIFY